MNINNLHESGLAKTEGGLLCCCFSVWREPAVENGVQGYNHLMIVEPNQKDEGSWFAVGPSGRCIARDPRLCGLSLNLAEIL